jgi:hypothetical protein
MEIDFVERAFRRKIDTVWDRRSRIDWHGGELDTSNLDLWLQPSPLTLDVVPNRTSGIEHSPGSFTVNIFRKTDNKMYGIQELAAVLQQGLRHANVPVTDKSEATVGIIRINEIESELMGSSPGSQRHLEQASLSGTVLVTEY